LTVRHYIPLLIGALALFSSCSTQKNTALSRSFHSTKVKYNILYNGNNAYEEGLQAIALAHEDNFQEVIPLYPVSDHKAAEASKAKMDRTIEKCRKCIKLHSIKKRPKIDSKKAASDEKYRAWLKHEEFNPSMPLAWLRLGQAEFHQGDFLGSVSTFQYVERHFDYDKDLVAQCQLWSVRAYAEMGWLYEADDLLRKVQIDDLSRKHASLYSAVSADLLMKQERWREAIPHVRIAKEDEGRKQYRPRFEYALGQLYETQGNALPAIEAYKRCIKLTPAWAMDFNARLRIASLDPDSRAARKKLAKMARLSKYEEYLDQIYGTAGDICLRSGDTLQALEQYALAAENSKRAGYDKAAVLIKAGDLYFGRQQYAEAQPCYSEALSIISAEDADYRRLSKRSEVLDGLVLQTGTVTLQDSLQALSKLSPEEQMRVCEALVAALIEQERQDSIRAAQEARREANEAADGPNSVATTGMLGGGGAGASGAWYFYNPNLLRAGKQTFRQKWGTRKLEDNWRRMIKGSPSFDFAEEKEEEAELDDELALDPGEAGEPGDLPGDESVKEEEVITDPHDPRYYLQQIPSTDEQLAMSDTLIAEALSSLVGIYAVDLEDEALAQATFDELCRRYPSDSRLPDLYYSQYLRALQREDSVAAARYRDVILARYPESGYAAVVADPDYFRKLQRAEAVADSLYERTYDSFRHGDYAAVKQQVTDVQAAYPLCSLMPRFLFLDAVSTAKTDGQDAFGDKLAAMVSAYPQSELSSMARDMLAMMNRGMESQQGTDAASTLAERRQEQADSLAAQAALQEEPEARHIVVIVVPQGAQNVNRLLYEVALYNFSQFMIKDFDLETVLQYSATESALLITGFDAAADVDWYKGLLQRNTDMMEILTRLQAVIL